MTRKRFVKFCMANGYSRNAANNIAKEVNSKGKSYAEVYAAVKKLSVALGPALSETVERVNKAFTKITNALSAGLAAFTKEYAAAMMEE